jgi:hypothetical protein
MSVLRNSISLANHSDRIRKYEDNERQHGSNLKPSDGSHCCVQRYCEFGSSQTCAGRETEQQRSSERRAELEERLCDR